MKNILLQAISDPQQFRKTLTDPQVIHRLELIGITVRLYQLHAPAESAKKTKGLGVTLCGRARGMRSSLITCKRCLAKLSQENACLGGGHNESTNPESKLLG